MRRMREISVEMFGGMRNPVTHTHTHTHRISRVKLIIDTSTAKSYAALFSQNNSKNIHRNTPAGADNSAQRQGCSFVIAVTG